VSDELVPVEQPEQAEEGPPPLPYVDDNGSELYRRLAHIRQLKLDKAMIEAAIKAEGIALAALLEKGARFTDHQGHEIEALVVRPGGKVRADLRTLKRVDPSAYARVTTEKLDTTKLRRALQAGLIVGPALAVFSTTPSDPYVRLQDLTQPEESDAQSDEDH
jgi:malonyl CoA-acyl carrier protein transacylase